MTLKPCPCGKTPSYIVVLQSNGRYMHATGSCCRKWEVAFEASYGLTLFELRQLGATAWNKMERGFDFDWREPVGRSVEEKVKIQGARVAALPETGFVRLPQIVGDPKANPPIIGIIPVSRSGWYKGIKEGRFPKPVKLHEGRSNFWRVEGIKALVERINNEDETNGG